MTTIARRYRQRVVVVLAALLLALTAPSDADADADLSLTMDVDETSPKVGTEIAFVLTLRNDGPEFAPVLVVTDPLPSGYEFIDSSGRGGYSPAAGVWIVGGLGAGGSVSRLINVRVNETGDYTNVAEVAVSGRADPDSVPGNGDPLEDDFAQITTEPVANVPPQIAGQGLLTTSEATPLTITLDDLLVGDPDNDYPGDFTLTVLPGPGYTETGGNMITPDTDVLGELTVGVKVDDGLDDSPPHGLRVFVTNLRPNFVVIMLDDLDERSLNDLLDAGMMPNLQSWIIDHALQFTESFVTHALCCPSRATFLTGRYSHNHGVISNKMYYGEIDQLLGGVGVFDDTVTLATRFQSLGYTTGHIGKYLNGYGSEPDYADIAPAFDTTYVPPGWDRWSALVDPGSYCVYDYYINHDGVLTAYFLEDGQTGNSAIYQTHVLSDLAEQYIIDHRGGPDPFFLSVMPLAPHWEGCAAAYDDNMLPEPIFERSIRPAPEDLLAPVPEFEPRPGYNEDTADKPDWIAAIPPLGPSDFVNIAMQYQARLRSLLAVDRMIGAIGTALDTEIDRTVLLFTSDNGWLYGEHRLGGKLQAYDESARVPFYVRIPGVESAPRADLVLNNDLAPTLLDLAALGYEAPIFDGRSLLPLLYSDSPPGWVARRQFLIEHWRLFMQTDGAPTAFAVRNPDSLYIETKEETWYLSPPEAVTGLELYDVASDPYQKRSLLHHPEDLPDPILNGSLELLKTCAGAGCAQYENQQ